MTQETNAPKRRGRPPKKVVSTPKVDTQDTKVEDLSKRVSELETLIKALSENTTEEVDSLEVGIKVSEGVSVPVYQTEGSAGVDLVANNDEPIYINGGLSHAIIPTGIFLELPKGTEAQVRSRSGLASKGIIVTNAPGTIDSDYRGEVKVLLTNIHGNRFVIEKGMRIAQLVIAKVPTVTFNEVKDLSSTERGEGGFGSTGV